MLHEAGYSYPGDPKISELTISEVRRLMEGRRVDAEIRKELREKRQPNDPGSGAQAGPRDSDFQKLNEFDEKVQQHRKN